VEAQRGFTLVEVVAAVAILALLSAAVVAMSLAQRPGSLRVATSGVDASLAAARALAATSGNGATLAFAPRTDGRGNALPGFTLTVYRGRPNAADAVTPSTVSPLVSDADVRERALGAPPFAIFLSSAGDPSGQGGYPQFDARGKATFATLAGQPPCPAGGFAFTFSGAHATQTRTLACRGAAVGTPMPLVTMTPSPVVLTPPSLVYDWPTAARQSFVATEWGYTRWYSAQSFTCGAATFPKNDPAPPYSAAHSLADESASPSAPSGVPISYANAPDSMQDAPARFYLDPAAGGICSEAISDASRRYTRLKVQVMGQLTATPATLAWTSAADRTQRSSMFGKTYDASALNLSVVSNTCAGVVNLTWGGPSYPSNPSASPSQRWLYLTPVAGPDGANVGGKCAISVASQYPGEPAATITINVPAEMRTWPVAVKYAVSGQQLAYAPAAQYDVGAWVNRFLGGATALASTCTAIAYNDTGFTQADANDATFAALGLSTDSNGCYTGGLVAYEPGGQSATYSVSNNCAAASLTIGSWSPTNATGQQVAIGASGGATATAGCTVTLSDGVDISPAYGSGFVAVQVIQVGYNITEQITSSGCSTRAVGVGYYVITCRGTATATYGANCLATGALSTIETTGDAGGSGEPIYAIAPVVARINGSTPGDSGVWTTVLTNAWNTIVNQEKEMSPDANGIVNVTTSGCPL
jgi:prepilin-type N-terminal cleavage/methylation domain-containing protein